MVTICCAVVGEGGSAFEVDIAEDASVSELKKAIRAEPEFGYHPNSKLQLFLAKKIKGKGAWLTQLDVVQGVKDTNGYTQLQFPSAKLRDVGLASHKLGGVSGQEAAAGKAPVHVLVVVPEPKEEFEQKKRLRFNVDRLKHVPQIDINSGEKYVTLPAAFVDKCGLTSNGDLMLYRRPQVDELWNFLREKVIDQKLKVLVVGPPGTGKSACTLSFAASLDREEWNVIWVHISSPYTVCVAMGTGECWSVYNEDRFHIPRIAGKSVFVCLDGYKYSDVGERFLGYISLQLKETDRLVICSSMATLGKRDDQDDMHHKLTFFFMYSWTKDEYLEAIEDEAFYASVEDKLDATSVSEVNEEDEEDEKLGDDDKKKRACQLKFYYAGGSSRFMFHFTTEDVKRKIAMGIESAREKTRLIEDTGGAYHSATINRLFGMHYDGPYSGHFPVSSYVAYLFAQHSGSKVISDLACRLNTSNNPSLDGHLFEWMFFAAVSQRKVKLFGDGETVDILPQATVRRFDPKKRFKKRKPSTVQNDEDRVIEADKYWLQPIAFNQGGYDAMYVDAETGEVIFVQMTRSDKHTFNMTPFHGVLLQLKRAKVDIKNVVIYFVVKPCQHPRFKISHVEGRGLLEQFDPSWKGPEERFVTVRAFEAPPSVV